MNRKYQIFTLCLFTIVLVNQPGIADKMTATFTFGKIEILKTGEREWAFLEKGAALTENDLIRMPPASLIRLKDAQGTFLPTLSGGRELSVKELIREGLQRRSATKGRRIDENLEGSPAIDVLPLGNKSKADYRSNAPDRSQSNKDAPQRVSNSELDQLRRQLDSLPAEMASRIFQLSSRDVSANDPYPGLNLHYAQVFYAALSDIELKGLSVPNRSLLYAQLLRRVGLNADLVADDKGELLVIFKSGVPFDHAKRITANQQLIYKQRRDSVWIPIQVQPQKQNFTTAWYNGAMEVRE